MNLRRACGNILEQDHPVRRRNPVRTTAIAVLLAIGCTSATPPPEPRTNEPAPPTPAPPQAVATPEAPTVTTPPDPTPFHTETPPTIAPPPTRFVASKKFPNTVWAATVDTSGGEWAVDITDWEIDGESPLAQSLLNREDYLDLPAGYGLLPEGWAIGDTWTLVTKKGTVVKKVTGYGLSMSGGSGTTFVHVRLGSAPSGAKGPVFALRGKPGKTPPQLVIPDALRPAALGPDMLATIHTAMIAGFDDETKPLVRRAKLREREVAIHPGRFPGGRTHVIVATHTTGASDDQTTLSAMLFVKADGRVEFFRQADVLGEITFRALADLDADGHDEILFEDAYHEGWYIEMVHWPRGKPKTRVLTGDGL